MIRTEILKKAESVVNGDRDQTYGAPEDNFRIIAELWSAYKGIKFTSTDVGAMMALLKIARIRSNPEKAGTAILTLPVMQLAPLSAQTRKVRRNDTG